MVIRITIDDELYKEIKDLAKSRNQFVMGFCNKLFADKVNEILAEQKKVTTS